MLEIMFQKEFGIKKITIILLLSIVLMLTACQDERDDNKANTGGQTIVRVNGDEITIHQLNRALAKLKMTANISENQFNEVRAKVVESLIDKQLFVQKAIENDIDRQPVYLQAVEDAKRDILMQMSLNKQLKSMNEPTTTEISRFYQERPELFRDRKIYKILEIITDNSKQSETIRHQVSSYSDLPALSSGLPIWFKENNIKFQMKPWIKPSEKIDNNVLVAIYAHKVGDIALIEQGNGYRFFKIIEMASSKVSEQDASALIKQYISKQNKLVKIKEFTNHLKKLAEISWSENYNEIKEASSHENSQPIVRNSEISVTDLK